MNLTKKSRGVSFLLTMFFGPLGLLYSSVTLGMVFLILAILTAGTVIIPLLIWVLAICFGDHYVVRHNESIDTLLALIGSNSANKVRS